MYRYNVKKPGKWAQSGSHLCEIFVVVEVRLFALSASSSILLDFPFEKKISAGWIFDGMTGSSFVRHGRTVMDDDRSMALQ